jgi:hypothetical protein
MKRWFAIWTIFALFIMARSTWYDPLYRNLPCSAPDTPPSLVCDLNWMGVVYVTFHHLIAVGTADFLASWLFLLVPPLLLWYGVKAILATVRMLDTAVTSWWQRTSSGR